MCIKLKRNTFFLPDFQFRFNLTLLQPNEPLTKLDMKFLIFNFYPNYKLNSSSKGKARLRVLPSQITSQVDGKLLDVRLGEMERDSPLR